MDLTPIRKALVIPVAMAVIAGLGLLGVTEQMTVQEAVGLLVANFFIWLVPNRK